MIQELGPAIRESAQVNGSGSSLTSDGSDSSDWADF
jgi:hypothetical protein